jgi:hypothetical protein
LQTHRDATKYRDCPLIKRPSTDAPGWIRTTDTRFRKPVLYPLSYGGVSARVARKPCSTSAFPHCIGTVAVVLVVALAAAGGGFAPLVFVGVAVLIAVGRLTLELRA